MALRFHLLAQRPLPSNRQRAAARVVVAMAAPHTTVQPVEPLERPLARRNWLVGHWVPREPPEVLAGPGTRQACIAAALVAAAVATAPAVPVVLAVPVFVVAVAAVAAHQPTAATLAQAERVVMAL